MDTFSYALRVDSERSLVWVECDGILGLESAQKMVRAAREEARIRGWPILYDFRLLQLPVQTPLAIVVRFPFLAGISNSGEVLRSAAVVDRDQGGHEVWETYRLASRQTGMHWNYFTRESEALDWLFDRNHWDIRHELRRS